MSFSSSSNPNRSHHHHHRWSSSSGPGRHRRQQEDDEDDPRRAMTRRSYQSSVQIRKRRKEERLLEKRQQPQRQHHQQQQQRTQQQEWDVSQQLAQFLAEQPPTCAALERFLLTGGDHQEEEEDHEDEEEEEGAALLFLQRLVERPENHSTCLRFLKQLRALMEQEGGEPVATILCLRIVESLVSTQQQPAQTTATANGNDDYYGAKHLGWSDLLLLEVAKEEGEPDDTTYNCCWWLFCLVSLLSRPIPTSTTTTTTTTPTTTATSIPELSGSILSHLFQDSSAAQALMIPPHRLWWDIVAALVLASSSRTSSRETAAVARLCAVILQHDGVTPGMDFLLFNRNSNDAIDGNAGCLTTRVMAHLLLDHSSATAAVSAAWMLEGLTRREDEAVEYLCRDSLLVQALVRQLALLPSSSTINDATLAAGNPSGGGMLLGVNPPSLLWVPTLRTIGNMITACHGRLLDMLLKGTTLVDSLSQLVNGILTRTIATTATTTTTATHASRSDVAAVLEEALWVMGCCCVDAGRPHHVMTTTVGPLWIPWIVSFLISNHEFASSFAVKRQAVASLWMALSMPPDDFDVGSRTRTSRSYQEREEIQAQLDSILKHFVWNCLNPNPPPAKEAPFRTVKHTASHENHHVMLLDALTQLLNVDHKETVVTSLRILQRLVRVVPEESRDMMRSQGVLLDRLHIIRDDLDASPSSRRASDLSSDLLDQLQEDDDDDDDDVVNTVDPMIVNGRFAFGLVPTTTMGMQQPVALSSSSHAAHSTSVAMGRGRGRTVPAWMDQQQQKQQSL